MWSTHNIWNLPASRKPSAAFIYLISDSIRRVYLSFLFPLPFSFFLRNIRQRCSMTEKRDWAYFKRLQNVVLGWAKVSANLIFPIFYPLFSHFIPRVNRRFCYYYASQMHIESIKLLPKTGDFESLSKKRKPGIPAREALWLEFLEITLRINRNLSVTLRGNCLKDHSRTGMRLFRLETVITITETNKPRTLNVRTDLLRKVDYPGEQWKSKAN